MDSALNCGMNWRINEKDADGFDRIVLSGDFDLYHAPAFAQAVAAHISQGARKIRFDLSQVGYLDSSGVGAIIKIVQLARRDAVDLRFVGIAGAPRKVLRMSNILPLLREEQGSSPL